MKWHWVKWGLLAAAVFSENAVAQGGLSDDELFDMEFEDLLKVKIRVSTKSEVEQSRAPSIISTFTRQQIDAFNAVSLIDIIKHAPSIETSMGANGNWRVSIRGERKPGNILMLLNGQPINNLYDGHALFDLPASIIEQVEIIRGPGSALYGTNAVAGVINVVTQSDAKRATAHLANYGGYGVSGQYSGQKESTSWSILFGLDTHDSEDLVDYYPEKVTNLIVSDTTNRHFEQQYFDISYTYSAFNQRSSTSSGR